MRRVKSAPANLAGMSNRKAVTHSSTLLNINENEIVIKKNGDNNDKNRLVTDGVVATINELVSDPNIIPMDESPLIVYLVMYIRENLKKKYNWEQAKEFLIQHIIRYAIGFIIHHHIYDKIPKLIEKISY